MTLRINERFNGGANGVAADTTNTTTTGYTGAGTSVFDTSQSVEGTASLRIDTSAGTRLAQFNLGTAVTDGYISFYVRPTAYPTGNTNLLNVGAAAGTNSAAVQMTSTGAIRMVNSSAVLTGTATADVLVLNEWNRIDFTFNSGVIKVELYAGNINAQNAVGTALSTSSRSGTTAVTTYAYRSLGIGVSSTLSMYFDALREDDTAMPAPVGVASALAATLAVVPSSGTVPFNVTATATASGGTGTPKTYAWSWGDGATTAAGSSNTATHQYTTAGTYTVTVTVVNT